MGKGVITMTQKELIIKYYNHTFDCEGQLEDKLLCADLLLALMAYSIDDIIGIITESFEKFDITTQDIPQYSNLDDCFKTAYLIEQSGIEKVDFIKMGFLLVGGATKKTVAYQKYGENQGKMAVLFGLLKLNPKQVIPGNAKPRTSFSLTALGKAFNAFSEDKQELLKTKMMLRCKLMQNYYLRGRQQQLLDEDIKGLLSESTYKRRGTNIRSFISIINKAIEHGF